jgi:HAD superfamily hydrolase (TIGR01490 family)
MTQASPAEAARSPSTPSGGPMTRLALFDLDHTLLLGDSDVLWCDFLMDQGVLARADFAQRNADIEARYKTGAVDAAEFANFYVSTLAGRSPAQWESVRQQFLREVIVPRIPQAAKDLVASHQRAGDLVVLTTATNRFLTELTAVHLGFAHVIATEPELVDGVFSGATTGVLNMRGGKVVRLHAWLQARGAQLQQFDSTGYSDSINDLPLLEAVDHAVVVHADARLAAIAAERGWRSLDLTKGDTRG